MREAFDGTIGAKFLKIVLKEQKLKWLINDTLVLEELIVHILRFFDKYLFDKYFYIVITGDTALLIQVRASSLRLLFLVTSYDIDSAQFNFVCYTTEGRLE